VASGIWSVEMTSQANYVPFVLSRSVGGFFSAIPQILGNEMIVNIFFLHQRGRAFAVYTTSFALGEHLSHRPAHPDVSLMDGRRCGGPYV